MSPRQDNPRRKPLVFLGGSIRTPPFTAAGRREAGQFLDKIQRGKSIGMPHSRPMPSIGPRCHELRVRDEGHHWRLIYRIDADAVLVAHIFAKSTRTTPASAIELSKRRFAEHDAG